MEETRKSKTLFPITDEFRMGLEFCHHLILPEQSNTKSLRSCPLAISKKAGPLCRLDGREVVVIDNVPNTPPLACIHRDNLPDRENGESFPPMVQGCPGIRDLKVLFPHEGKTEIPGSDDGTVNDRPTVPDQEKTILPVGKNPCVMQYPPCPERDKGYPLGDNLAEGWFPDIPGVSLLKGIPCRFRRRIPAHIK